ncbi:BspA family leucine-rich repeat surface protein [Jejuia spongiicola]|uniref:BspA family leucine-rich repeat surface protein n=1 Tax=Jejuia spongiicola TaxID=2942207 RepID=A0ABT0QI95_9FLAO|nr:BspA family leucine-rich repeat surface protein [Jejuia spongiicola]MCL6296728.1 BspA family leucine-rich repeat surface protein [Jejuia spongiicola]
MKKLLQILLYIPFITFAQTQIGGDINGKTVVDNFGNSVVSLSEDGSTFAALFNDENGDAFQNSFTTTWTVTDADEITIAINPDATGNYNYTIDWGDGTIESGKTGNASHTYSNNSGTNDYQIKITEDFPAIRVSLSGDEEKLKSIDQWGEIKWETMYQAFRDCKNMQVNATDAPDLSLVTTMYRMFYSCTAFTGHESINTWHLNSIEDLNSMFRGCENFNQDLNSWDTSNVVEMSYMFQDALAFNGNISSWDVSQVGADGVGDTQKMFNNAVKFNQDISSWQFKENADFTGMFEGAIAFNQPLPNWINTNVDGLKMSEMFKDAKAFNQNLSSWDASKIKVMSNMFNGAISFNQNLSSWVLSGLTAETNTTMMNNMFDNSAMSRANYDATLIAWANNENTPSDVTLGALSIEYCTAEIERQSLIDNKGWTFVGDTKCPNIIYVDLNGNNTNGTDWANAYTSIKTAINNANKGDHIYIAIGTYQEGVITINSGKDLVIKGGYNTTTNIQEDYSTLDGQESNNILSTSLLTNNTLFDHLIITNGGNVNNGGGMLNSASSPTLTNVIFTKNTAFLEGGGMYNANNSSPVLINVTFVENASGKNGGGMANFASTSTSPTNPIILTNVIFYKNTAVNNGAGMFNHSSNPTLINVTFTGNTSENLGGGMQNNIQAKPLLYNTVFYNNSAGTNGDISDIAGDGTINTSSSHNASDKNESILDNNIAFVQLTQNPFTNSTDPAGGDDEFGTADDGLIPNTPDLIDKGDDNKNNETFDLAGQIRLFNTIDIGAYERQSTLSINSNNILKKHIHLYPNPTASKLFISNPLNINLKTISIHDISGRLILTKTIKTNTAEQSINISKLSSGIYLLSLKSDTENMTKRIIKQ